MSRSRKHTPIHGNTCAQSEKDDKRRYNRAYRRKIKSDLHSISDLERFMFPIKHEIENVWSFAKDGKWWFGGYKIGRIRRIFRFDSTEIDLEEVKQWYFKMMRK